MDQKLAESITHLAGIPTRIRNRVIQRCQICGEKLYDQLDEHLPHNPDGTPTMHITWAQGYLVRIHISPDGNNTKQVVPIKPRSDNFGHHTFQKLPPDNCLTLVEM